MRLAIRLPIAHFAYNNGVHSVSAQVLADLVRRWLSDAQIEFDATRLTDTPQAPMLAEGTLAHVSEAPERLPRTSETDRSQQGFSPMKLQGIAWNHTRGYLPMVATAQRFSETHPDVEIVWRKRTLQEFADYPIDRLAEEFDLLVIDHPFVGYASGRGQGATLLPLDQHLPATFLADQARNSVGRSHESYLYGGHQWALAIDAAAPVSSYRPDLLEKHRLELPQTHEELLELARHGRVVLPAVPVDCLMHFFMFCCGLGEEPFASEKRVVSEEVGVAALRDLRELVMLCPPECLERSPIATYEAMASGEQAVYCPFAYGYSNYARPGYAQNRLRFGGLVTFSVERRFRSTLGGAGLAISHRCQHVAAALEYAQYVASPDCQRRLYFTSGGQPGHRTAWLDPTVNAACGDFFQDTLPTLDAAYLRPRYDGYLDFQDRAGLVVHRYLREGGDPRAALNAMELLHRQSYAGDHDAAARHAPE